MLQSARFQVFAILLASGAPVATGGAQWTPVTSPTDVELRGLSVVSPNVVWASGQRGTVVRTTDGGRTWSRDTVPGAGALDLRAIAATSALVAHAISIGDSSRIYGTADGGRTWTRRWSATRKGTFLDAIRFWDARNGIAMSDPVDGRFLLLVTADGGDSWQEVPASALPPALPGEGGFAASGSCLTVAGHADVWFASGGASVARVYHSADRGRSWTVSDTPIRAGVGSAGIFSVAFRDARNGVIAGGDYAKPTLRGRNLALTRDGGRTWTLADSTSSPAGYRSAVTYVPGIPASTLVAVGLSGTDISRDRGVTWTSVDTVAYNSVAFATPTRGWAVGPKGRIARWSTRP
ncbi:MAG: glycosyl hydrolase [Gemmatimonadaceae bacterium]|nr:glycosyl hydrolase [Gemmatimonadaceae bacterium]NUS34202.1 glycosyl hydrolase [Gemmatimonadaceae bacterium]NUS47979.1 glycosyl hydrolase [Gemmatimonadaceae bacterium]